MSAYNIIRCNIKCSNCNRTYASIVQFKYGDTWQFEYKIGDKIKWGGNDIGNPKTLKVKVYGIIQSSECPLCTKENLNDEFDVIIENNTIIDVRPMENIKDYRGEDVNFKILL